MRTVPAALLTIAEAVDGHESSILVEIDLGDGELLTFCEGDHIAGAEPRVMEIASINMSTGDHGATVGSVNIKLSDNDSYLLDLMCSRRFEGCRARILLIFDANVNSYVELFIGRVGSPLTWEEEDKTLTFDIVALYESGDVEVPFAPEEDDDIQEFAWNQPWPRIYGTPVDVPAVLVVDAPKGTLIRELQSRYTHVDLTVSDGIEFPIGEIVTVEIGNERMTGQFEEIDDDPTVTLRFHIQERNVSKGLIFSQSRLGLDTAEGAPEGYESWTFDPRYAMWDSEGIPLAGNWLFLIDSAETLEAGRVDVIEIISTGSLYGVVKFPSFVGNKNYIVYQKGNATRGQLPWITPSGLYLIDIGAKADIRGVLDVNDTLWPAGTEIRLVQDVKYVVSDRAGDTVLQVRAWREVKLDERGGRKQELVVVPPDFYTVDNADELAGRACTTLTLAQPLSSRGAGWDDTLYVTVRSAIGRNIADIIQDLVEESGLTINTASFSAVEDACENYPMDFAILDQQDALALANQVAFQGRCGMVVLGSEVHLKYLSVAPESVVFTYGDDTALEATLQLSSTELTELANDLWISWKKRGSQDSPERLHYKSEDSIEAFGRKKKEFNFWAYRYRRLVQKSAQFWFNRWSRVWRKIRVVGDLDALEVIVYDDVKSTLSELETNGVVESLEHNSDTNQIAALMWTPVEAGTCEFSDSAYLDDTDDERPADLNIPDGEEIAEVIEVSPLDFSLSEPETHVGEALTNEVSVGSIGGVFNAKLYKGNTNSGVVVEESVEVQNLTDSPVTAGTVMVVHKSADGTYYAVKAGGGTTQLTGGGTLFGVIALDGDGEPEGFSDAVDPNDTRWNTSLTVDEEAAYQTWKLQYSITTADEVDYDYRGAYKIGAKPDPDTMHWSDIFKKPNHPTFSDESRYAYLMPHKAGSWDGETFLPPDTNPDHYFTADIFTVAAAGSTLQETRIGRRIGSGGVYDGQVLPVYIGADGTAWILSLDSPFGLAVVRSDSADKDAIPARLYLTSTLTDDGPFEDISVKLPALQTTAKVTAGTWLIVIRKDDRWLGYLPLIRPRVPA